MKNLLSARAFIGWSETVGDDSPFRHFYEHFGMAYACEVMMSGLSRMCRVCVRDASARKLFRILLSLSIVQA